MTRAPDRHPLEEIVARGQCMGCGMCAATFEPPAPGVRVEIAYDPDTTTYGPRVSGWSSGNPTGSFVCPGADMDMSGLSRRVWGREPPDTMLGEYVETFAAYSNDADERARAASGGVVPALLRHLFDTGAIERAYVLGTEPNARDGTGRAIRNAAQFTPAHGSHYHPFDFGAGLREFLEARGRFAFVGLPCQIAGLRMALLERPVLATDAVVLISLFCGGVNSYRGIGYYLARHGVDPAQVRRISYREGAWPGRIRVELEDGSSRLIARIRGNSRAMVMHYMAAFQGFWMLKRCRICPDQVGDFADVSVGDPHSERFRSRAASEGGGGFSAVVARSEAGRGLLAAAIAAGYLTREPLSSAEVVESQGYTLVQRRHADVYAAVDRRLGGTPPRITIYSALAGRATSTARRVAWIDLMKLKLGLRRPLPAVIWVWQVLEYLVLRFPLAELGRRLRNIVFNR